MDVGRNPQTNPDARLDLTRPNRRGIKLTLEEAERTKEVRSRELENELERLTDSRSDQTETSDRIEVSPRAKLLAGEGTETPEADAERAERVAELKAQAEAGKLNTPERVERAADAMLADES